MAWTAKITHTRHNEITGGEVLEGEIGNGNVTYLFWAQTTMRGIAADVYRRTSKNGNGWASASLKQEQAIKAAFEVYA